MRALAALILLCPALHAAERAVTFQRGANIFVSDLSGNKPGKVAAGNWPDISPDGTRVAYNTQNDKTPERHIAITDLGTGKSTRLKGIPSDNCHSPVWSPDGSRIVFQIFADGDWHIGLADAGGDNFRYVLRAAKGHRSYWDASWAPDGKSLFCQDMTAIYRVSLEGAILQKWVLSDLVGQAGTFSSGSHLSVSPDGKTLLFDLDMDEEVTLEGWEGPPPAIWKMNLASGKAERVTPKGTFAWQPGWISPEEFLFTTLTPGKKINFSIKRWKLADGTSSLVITNAHAPSVSHIEKP